MFCSALNNVGDAPNTELRETIKGAEAVFKEAGLSGDPSVKTVLRAANERAGFDRVTQMLRGEFRHGLARTNRYSDEQLDEIVRDIVNIAAVAVMDAGNRTELGGKDK